MSTSMKSPSTVLARTLLAAGLWGWLSTALAWSDHPLCTWSALEGMPEIADRAVLAEPFDRFLQSEAAALPKVLAQEEAWARQQLPHYAPRPDALAFQGAAPTPQPIPQQLRLSFLRALRVNEHAKLSLYLQRHPGAAVAAVAAERRMDWRDITTLSSGSGAKENRYERIQPDEPVPVLEVLATASNEPDYGLDLGLWSDNGTAQGQAAGFGPQPFGNPRFDYSGQAPFHMGFYHEAAIVYAAAPFLQRTYPEARIHMALTLARHAFASGHPYWGWRFTGWAIHYVQDLGQPYHARVLPGLGVGRMLWINAQDLLGRHQAKLDAVNLVANRHTVLENFQFRHMALAYEQGRMDDPLLQALRDARQDRSHWRLTPPSPSEPGSLRDIVSADAAALADALDAQLARSLPARYTSDPATVLPESDQLDMALEAQRYAPAEYARLMTQLQVLMQHVGRDTRAVVRAALQQ